ncbi:F0F1 ATP synthase subunit A [Candidatus Babeliales bacterium]|nr:F0F1 ATP synthase subunit A [Candidatus Babeliales bacterium]MBP9844189.1 F0F1 ATP synthase subunit A [Candidatus Babeliales bacterium]
MQDHNLLTGHQWQPLTHYGFTHKFWTLNTDTLMSTIVVTIVIMIFSLYAHYAMQKKQSVAQFVILKYVEGFKDLLHQTLQSAPLNHLAFIGSLFTFIFCCNTISFVPFLEEPTKDLNTTLAFGLISFFYVQGYAIQYKGIKTYLLGFIDPFFLMLPLNVIGTVTSIISLSFRLFGNIFGGYVISSLYFHKIVASSVLMQILGLITASNLCIFLLFGFFEGMIQAFVFAMLTLTYLSMEIAPEEESE